MLVFNGKIVRVTLRNAISGVLWHNIKKNDLVVCFFCYNSVNTVDRATRIRGDVYYFVI